MTVSRPWDMRGSGVFGLVVPQADVEWVRALGPPRGVALVTPADLAGAITQRDADGRAIAAEICGALIGRVVHTAEGRAELAAAADDLELLFEPEVALTLDLDREGDAAWHPWLAARLAEHGADLLREGAQVRRSLATLRREHADAMVRFAELEGAAATWVTPSRVRRLHHPASRSQVALGGGDRAQRNLRQTAAVSPTGLATLEFTIVEASGEGDLSIELRVGGDVDPAASWTVPVRELSPGPLRVSLERALTRGGADVTLELTWLGAGSVVLALGPATPLQEYAAVTDGGLNLGAPLALTLWSMPAGLRVRQPMLDDPTTTDGAAIRATQAPCRVAMAADELQSVERLLPEIVAVDYRLVRYRADERDVLVHPVNGDTTVAIIRNIPARAARGVSALVVVDHREASAVEFGLALVPAKTTHADPVSLIQRWTVLEPLIYSEAPGEVRAGPSGPMDLLMASRMANGADAHLAWAYVKRVDIVS